MHRGYILTQKKTLNIKPVPSLALAPDCSSATLFFKLFDYIRMVCEIDCGLLPEGIRNEVTEVVELSWHSWQISPHRINPDLLQAIKAEFKYGFEPPTVVRHL